MFTSDLVKYLIKELWNSGEKKVIYFDNGK